MAPRRGRRWRHSLYVCCGRPPTWRWRPSSIGCRRSDPGTATVRNARMISVVIPVFNERESLAELHAEISEVADREPLDIEIIFVDDGSRDGSWDVIAELAKADPHV